MSIKVITKVLCDECGAETENETVTFSWLEKSYEVDLCDKHLDALERVIEPIAEVARRTKGHLVDTSNKRKRAQSGAVARGLNPSDVRQWANKKNISIPPRGRIPANVLERYQNDNKAS